MPFRSNISNHNLKTFTNIVKKYRLWRALKIDFFLSSLNFKRFFFLLGRPLHREVAIFIIHFTIHPHLLLLTRF